MERTCRYLCTTVCAMTSFCSFSINTSKNSTFRRSVAVRIRPAESAPAASASSSAAIVSHCFAAAIRSLARSFSCTHRWRIQQLSLQGCFKYRTNDFKPTGSLKCSPVYGKRSTCHATIKIYKHVNLMLHLSLTSAPDWVVSSGHLPIAPTIKEAVWEPE